MANFNEVVFSIAGSKNAIKDVVMQMANNIAGSASDEEIAPYLDSDDELKSCKSADETVNTYRRLIEDNFPNAFDYEGPTNDYNDWTCNMSYGGNEKAKFLTFSYTTLWNANLDDVDTFFYSLVEGTKVDAVLLWADEGDGYDEIAENDYRWDPEYAMDSVAGPAAEYLEQLKGLLSGTSSPYDAKDYLTLAYNAALCHWGTWEGESVLKLLKQEGHIDASVPEEDAEQYLVEHQSELVERYAGKPYPLDANSETIAEG